MFTESVTLFLREMPNGACEKYKLKIAYYIHMKHILWVTDWILLSFQQRSMIQANKKLLHFLIRKPVHRIVSREM